MQKKPTYEKNFYRNLGKTLKEERMKHNLTQEEVSSIANIPDTKVEYLVYLCMICTVLQSFTKSV